MAKHDKKLRSRTAAWLIVVAMMVLAGISVGQLASATTSGAPHQWATTTRSSRRRLGGRPRPRGRRKRPQGATTTSGATTTRGATTTTYSRRRPRGDAPTSGRRRRSGRRHDLRRRPHLGATPTVGRPRPLKRRRTRGDHDDGQADANSGATETSGGPRPRGHHDRSSRHQFLGVTYNQGPPAARVGGKGSSARPSVGGVSSTRRWPLPSGSASLTMRSRPCLWGLGGEPFDDRRRRRV